MNESIQRLVDYAVEKNLSNKRIRERCHNALNSVRSFCKEIEQLRFRAKGFEGSAEVSISELISYSDSGDPVSFVEFDSGDFNPEIGSFRFVSVVDQNDVKIRVDIYDIEDRRFVPENKYISVSDAVSMVMDWALANNVILPQ